MSGLESAAIALGTALTKLACDMLLGKDTVAGTVGSNAIDVVAERFTNTRHGRQFRRVWEQVAELVADRVEPLARRRRGREDGVVPIEGATRCSTNRDPSRAGRGAGHA